MTKHDRRPFEINLGDRRGVCQSLHECSLLLKAKAVADGAAAANGLTLEELRQIKDAFQRDNLGTHQRLVKLAIDRLTQVDSPSRHRVRGLSRAA